MTQTKNQTNELETHLEKYGYIRPKGKCTCDWLNNSMEGQPSLKGREGEGGGQGLRGIIQCIAFISHSQTFGTRNST